MVIVSITPCSLRRRCAFKNIRSVIRNPETTSRQSQAYRNDMSLRVYYETYLSRKRFQSRPHINAAIERVLVDNQPQPHGAYDNTINIAWARSM